MRRLEEENSSLLASLVSVKAQVSNLSMPDIARVLLESSQFNPNMGKFKIREEIRKLEEENSSLLASLVSVKAQEMRRLEAENSSLLASLVSVKAQTFEEMWKLEEENSSLLASIV
eukprot:1409489-Rhodomonas_salina.2